jgi:hypothetical protein
VSEFYEDLLDEIYYDDGDNDFYLGDPDEEYPPTNEYPDFGVYE